MNNVILTTMGMVLAGSSAMMTLDHSGDVLAKAGDRAIAGGAISVATQIAAAVQLYDLQEGRRYEARSLAGLVEADYLKSIPDNPARAGAPEVLIDTDGERYAAVPLGGQADGVCRALSKMTDGDRIGCLDVDGRKAAYLRV